MKATDTKATEKKSKFSASKRVEKNGVSKTVRVDEVDNGFIVTVEKSWKDKKNGYQYEEKRYITKDNPFENPKEVGNSPMAESLEKFLEDGTIQIVE
jgi:hypothetical protein